MRISYVVKIDPTGRIWCRHSEGTSWVPAKKFTPKDYHTKDDLAMALELAAHIEETCENFDDVYLGFNAHDGDPIYVWHWLRAEVIATLRGER